MASPLDQAHLRYNSGGGTAQAVPPGLKPRKAASSATPLPAEVRGHACLAKAQQALSHPRNAPLR